MGLFTNSNRQEQCGDPTCFVSAELEAKFDKNGW